MDAKQPVLSEQLSSSSGSFELVLSAVLFGLVGFWLDRQFGTSPWIMVITTLMGFAGAAISLYYRYRHDLAALEAAKVRDAA